MAMSSCAGEIVVSQRDDVLGEGNVLRKSKSLTWIVYR